MKLLAEGSRRMMQPIEISRRCGCCLDLKDVELVASQPDSDDRTLCSIINTWWTIMDLEFVTISVLIVVVR